jgi:hypothetical protein
MADMLASGELVAAIGADTDHPDVKTLIPNAKEAAFESLHARGHYPINHLIVVKDALLETDPDLGPRIFDAFARAKRLYVERLAAGAIASPTPIDELHKRVMDITGKDPPTLRHRPQPPGARRGGRERPRAEDHHEPRHRRRAVPSQYPRARGLTKGGTP